MQKQTVHEQVNDIIRAHVCNEKMKKVLHAAWEMLESFLGQRGKLPDRLQSIERDLLAAFVEHCRQSGVSEELLPQTLCALRMLLKQAGHNAATLATLTAPLRRERTQNDINGKYRYRLHFMDPVPSPSQNGPLPDGQSKISDNELLSN
jgi:hypothetical protein